jgi:hypothetical protein
VQRHALTRLHSHLEEAEGPTGLRALTFQVH